MPIDYTQSGVDIKAGDDLVDWLSASENSEGPVPHQDRLVQGIGGFASLFRFGFPEMKSPCLVTCTDGVGTKVKLASHFQDYSSIGQDLVAMCVNDLICTGGQPLAFLDYYASGKLDLVAAKSFLTSVKKACTLSNCALIGGETAEMPGVYHEKDFDCAGFAIGVVDEGQRWGPHKVKDGDVVLGVSSSGFHSNGYSLLRKVFAKDLDQYRKILLEPTALYVKLCERISKLVDVHAAAHMTGGGIENIPRVLPEKARWIKKDWAWPEIFREVQSRTQMRDEQMLTTLNCGVGFCFVLAADQVDLAKACITEMGFSSYELGKVQL